MKLCYLNIVLITQAVNRSNYIQTVILYVHEKLHRLTGNFDIKYEGRFVILPHHMLSETSGVEPDHDTFPWP